MQAYLNEEVTVKKRKKHIYKCMLEINNNTSTSHYMTVMNAYLFLFLKEEKRRRNILIYKQCNTNHTVKCLMLQFTYTSKVYIKIIVTYYISIVISCYEFGTLY